MMDRLSQLVSQNNNNIQHFTKGAYAYAHVGQIVEQFLQISGISEVFTWWSWSFYMTFQPVGKVIVCDISAGLHPSTHQPSTSTFYIVSSGQQAALANP